MVISDLCVVQSDKLPGNFRAMCALTLLTFLKYNIQNGYKTVNDIFE